LTRVYVDERERGSGVPEVLRGLGVTVIFRRLDVGDYVVSERMAIERKSAEDFAHSVVDGRLFEQARRLVDSYEKPVLLLEGSLRRAARFSGVRFEALLGAVTALVSELGLYIVYTGGVRESALAIKMLADKEQRGGGTYVVLHKKPKLSSVRDWQLYIVQSLPYVGPKVAKRLLETFGSVYRVFTASVTELARIEGLGEKRAGEIVRILRAPYTDGVRRGGARSITDYIKEKNSSQQGSQ